MIQLHIPTILHSVQVHLLTHPRRQKKTSAWIRAVRQHPPRQPLTSLIRASFRSQGSQHTYTSWKSRSQEKPQKPLKKGVDETNSLLTKRRQVQRWRQFKTQSLWLPALFTMCFSFIVWNLGTLGILGVTWLDSLNLGSPRQPRQRLGLPLLSCVFQSPTKSQEATQEMLPRFFSHLLPRVLCWLRPFLVSKSLPRILPFLYLLLFPSEKLPNW